MKHSRTYDEDNLKICSGFYFITEEFYDGGMNYVS